LDKDGSIDGNSHSGFKDMEFPYNNDYSGGSYIGGVPSENLIPTTKKEQRGPRKRGPRKKKTNASGETAG